MIDGILERLAAELGPDTEDRRHRRPGADDRTLLALGEDLRRRSDARRPAPDLGKKPLAMLKPSENYFNYFTEIEEHFRIAPRHRAVSALAARLGADRDLEECGHPARSRVARHRRGLRKVARASRRARAPRRSTRSRSAPRRSRSRLRRWRRTLRGRAKPAPPPFSLEDVKRVSGAQRGRAAQSRAGGSRAVRSKRWTLDALYADLEQLEQRLTAIEEKMIARLRASASEEALFEARRTLGSRAEAVSRKDDRGTTRAAGKAVPGAQTAGIGRHCRA